MKYINYLTIIFSVVFMNFAQAELKTFGTPEDSQTEEAPSEENLPLEESPEEGTPEEGIPTEGNPEEGAPQDDAPEEDAPEEDDEIPTASENSEISDDQPIKFKEEYMLSASLLFQSIQGQTLSIDLIMVLDLA